MVWQSSLYNTYGYEFRTLTFFIFFFLLFAAFISASVIGVIFVNPDLRLFLLRFGVPNPNSSSSSSSLSLSLFSLFLSLSTLRIRFFKRRYANLHLTINGKPKMEKSKVTKINQQKNQHRLTTFHDIQNLEKNIVEMLHR